ncbi:MAG TPA: NlpC/P60 family protein [Candidatus Koribacter sp.]|jgi:hypothetical protein
MGDSTRIVNFARTLLNSHYIWGAAGNTPNASDGIGSRTSHVTLAPNSLDPHSPSVFAAQCTTLSTHYVCAGRYRHLQGGRQAGASDWDLNHYLDELRKQPSEAMWCPYANYFTPRLVQGDNTIESRGKIIWGEDCRYVRHFDCVGFTNFVITKTCFDCQLDISAYRSKPWLTAIDKAAANVPGDIVFRDNDHIGFLTEKGTVIQAQDAANGVHESETYVPNAWTDRMRIQAGYIRHS